MGVRSRIGSLLPRVILPQRSSSALSFSEFMSYFNYGSNAYSFGLNQTLLGDKETIDGNYLGHVRQAFKDDSVVFACIVNRMSLFSEARFQFRERTSGRPGKLFGKPSLARLEIPWPGGTTGDLLARALLDIDLAGNHYGRRVPNGITRLRPDWVDIILGSESEPNDPAGAIDAEVIGYIYYPGGRNSQRTPVTLGPSEIYHFAPLPDPEAAFRGMSWLSPVINEILADKATTKHKLKFFENGATPNLVIKINESERTKFLEWVKTIREGHEGPENAYKSLFIGPGADATVVGADLKQLDFKVTQGAGETRIAAAAQVPPVIVGLSEGLAAATYSNYGQARRRFADMTIRPLWRNFAGSVSRIIDAPGTSELWYDDRDIPALQEDQKDSAEILYRRAQTIRTLTDAGYEAESVVAAVDADDLSLLKHSGLFSVQLQPPRPEDPLADDPSAVKSLDGQPMP
jgi:hypothetical protein